MLDDRAVWAHCCAVDAFEVKLPVLDAWLCTVAALWETSKARVVLMARIGCPLKWSGRSDHV